MDLETSNFTIVTVGPFGLMLREVRKLGFEFLTRKPASAGIAVRAHYVEAGKRKVMESTLIGHGPVFYVVFRGHKLPIARNTFEQSSIAGGLVTRYGSFDERWTTEAGEAVDRYIAESGYYPFLDLRGLNLQSGRNREGLTWGEWLAATLQPELSAFYSHPETRLAWARGECPTDHAPGVK